MISHSLTSVFQAAPRATNLKPIQQGDNRAVRWLSSGNVVPTLRALRPNRKVMMSTVHMPAFMGIREELHRIGERFQTNRALQFVWAVDVLILNHVVGCRILCDSSFHIYFGELEWECNSRIDDSFNVAQAKIPHIDR